MGLASRLVALSDRAILRVAGLAGIAAPRIRLVKIYWVAASKLPLTNPLKSKLLLQADHAWIGATARFLLLWKGFSAPVVVLQNSETYNAAACRDLLRETAFELIFAH